MADKPDRKKHDKKLDAGSRTDILPSSQSDNLFPGVAVVPAAPFQRRLQAVNAQSRLR